MGANRGASFDGLRMIIVLVGLLAAMLNVFAVQLKMRVVVIVSGTRFPIHLTFPNCQLIRLYDSVGFEASGAKD